MSSMPSKFLPRPEAQVMPWSELMPPVQQAVHDLLVRIQGAHYSINPDKADNYPNGPTQQTGNCFLVYGSRGTGKTTVLLNAQWAVCQKQDNTFFVVPPGYKETHGQKLAREDAQKHARNLRDSNIVWLDILNLEPLPNEANLLTVLLTQIRNALNSHNDKQRGERRSIFEEEADSAKQQLYRLIENATLMWQNINESNTRELSSRQVKAADIYAAFQANFKKAMDKLVEELQDRFAPDKQLSIVLPIDNIDRSTDHLQSIVKLAQLVSHPKLWFVMAGDRVEVETFLERAYWKELIKGSKDGDTQGKRGSEGEDEAQLMARRQANAIAQKLWPPNHRVEINLVKPKETLAFEYRHNPNSNTANDIRALLGRVQVPTTTGHREQKYSATPIKDRMTLIDWFEVTDIANANPKKPLLTLAAQHGLLLSARSVLDLWQLLDWLDKDEERSLNYRDYKAEKIVRTLLRNAIASSNLPNRVAQKLQNVVLHRGEKGGTILSFDEDVVLEIRPLTSINHDFECALAPVISSLPQSQYRFRSQLTIVNIDDINWYIKQTEEASYGQIAPAPLASCNNKMGIELPSLVKAWLMVLYDILVLAEADSSSWLIGDLDLKWLNVSVHHDINRISKTGKYKNQQVELYWKAPYWELFWGRNVFRLSWKNFCIELAAHFQNKHPQQAQIPMPRILAAAWIACVVNISLKLIKSIDPTFDHQEKIKLQEFGQFMTRIDNILALEKEVVTAAGNLYELIQQQKQSQLVGSQPLIPAAFEVMLYSGEWLETQLIYFLSSAYVPHMPAPDATSRHEKLWAVLGDNHALKRYWVANLPFTIARLEEKYKGKVRQKKSGQTDQLDAKAVKSTVQLLFADLCGHLNNTGT
ncbi:MAG: hypothetical protein NTV43_07495 [Methylococcales bacterium]|nr:hypothetical protein [Methylococcales bacterium]